MLRVKWSVRFTKAPYRREIHVETFEGKDMLEIDEQIQSYVAVKASQGWELKENEIFFVEEIEEE